MATNYEMITKSPETLARFMDEVVERCVAKSFLGNYKDGDKRCRSCPFYEGCGDVNKTIGWLWEEAKHVIPVGRAELGKIVERGGEKFIVVDHSAETTALIPIKGGALQRTSLPRDGYLNSGMRDHLLNGYGLMYMKIFGKSNVVRHTVDLTALDGSKDRFKGKVRNCHDYISVLDYSKYKKYSKYVNTMSLFNPGVAVLSTVGSYNRISTTCLGVTSNGLETFSVLTSAAWAPLFLVVMSDVEVAICD